jgi:ABC-2 type transport system permease protein
MKEKISWGRVRSIGQKEVRHIVRDPFTLAMALGVPVLLVVFFGFVFNFDVQDIRLAVVDRDQTRASRELTDVFASSGYFRIQKVLKGGTPLELVDREEVKGVLIIEPGFEKKIRRGEPAVVQLALDGADNQTAGIISSYLAGIENAASRRLTGLELTVPIRLDTRFLYNPELNSRWFIVPGLTVVVIGILSILLTALTVAREWENGSMELLLSTPVQPIEIILGKLAPYTVLGLGGIALVYIAARLSFGVPFRGHHIVFLFACLAFLATALSHGLLISIATRHQQLAMQMANITGMLPSMLLSGFIFPVESMPTFFQVATMALPPRWFMEICRNMFLKGSSLFDLAVPLLVLWVMHLVILRVAVAKFKKDLEP